MNEKFKNDIKRGETGEHLVWNLLNKYPKVRNVIDVRNDKRFQAEDVDFLVETTDRQFRYVEVKTDYMAHRTGNIAFEISSSGNPGCLQRTKADEVFYYLPETNTVHVLNVSKVRDYIDTYRLQERPMGDSAIGYLIPIDRLCEFGAVRTVKEVY